MHFKELHLCRSVQIVISILCVHVWVGRISLQIGERTQVSQVPLMWGIELQRCSFAKMLGTDCSHYWESTDLPGESELTLPVFEKDTGQCIGWHLSSV